MRICVHAFPRKVGARFPNLSQIDSQRKLRQKNTTLEVWNSSQTCRSINCLSLRLWQFVLVHHRQITIIVFSPYWILELLNICRLQERETKGPVAGCSVRESSSYIGGLSEQMFKCFSWGKFVFNTLITEVEVCTVKVWVFVALGP